MIYNETLVNDNIKLYLETKDGKALDYITIQLLRLATSIVKRPQFKTNDNTEDLVQHAVESMLTKLHLLDLSKGRSYSYFYRAIYLSFLYDIRKESKQIKTQILIGNTIQESYEQDFGVDTIIDLTDMWLRAEQIITLHHSEVSASKEYLFRQLENIKAGKETDIEKAQILIRRYRDYIRYNRLEFLHKRAPKYKALRNTETNIEYASISEARKSGYKTSNLAYFLSGKYATKGYSWEFVY